MPHKQPEEMREKILNKLQIYHRKQGVAFLSEKEAVNYFKGLVELIENLINHV